MKIYLTDAVERRDVSVAEEWKRALFHSGNNNFVSAPSPEEADLILFVDCHLLTDGWQMNELRQHDLVRQFPNKVMVYNERDRPWCVLPGLYVSMPKFGFDPKNQRAVAYWKLEESQSSKNIIPDLLFSFIGSITHPVRKEILKLNHPRGLVDVAPNGFLFFDSSSTQFHKRRELFDQTLSRSKFVLCPRGHGTSSIRMYETLRMGRVPVVIADQWVPPSGPAWDSCIIRVAEKDVTSVPAILESAENKYETMAENARRVYEDWFAPDVIFDRMAGEMEILLNQGATRSPAKKGIQYWLVGLRAAKGAILRKIR